MDRRSQWIVRNGTFAVALYLGAVEHVEWLKYAIAAFAWSSLAMIVWTLPEESPWRPLAPIPLAHAGAMVFDLAVLAVMFVAHWYWSACACAIASGCAAIAQARATSKS